MNSEKILEKLKFEIHRHIPRTLEAEADLRYLANDMVLQVRGFIWGESLGVEEIRYPADWIQAFKIRWFPKWMLLRWPPEYTVEVFDVKAIYPDFKPSVPDCDSRLVIYRRETRNRHK